MKKGFGGMSKEKLKIVSSRGGKVAHVTGRARKWNEEEARKAGLKSASTRASSEKKRST